MVARHSMQDTRYVLVKSRLVAESDAVLVPAVCVCVFAFGADCTFVARRCVLIFDVPAAWRHSQSWQPSQSGQPSQPWQRGSIRCPAKPGSPGNPGSPPSPACPGSCRSLRSPDSPRSPGCLGSFRNPGSTGSLGSPGSPGSPPAPRTKTQTAKP